MLGYPYSNKSVTTLFKPIQIDCVNKPKQEGTSLAYYLLK